MVLIAATATEDGLSARGVAVLIVVTVLWFLGYLITCVLWPFAACRKCKGSGRFRSPSGRAWRSCRKCKGSGARLRTGRRVINAVRHLDDKAQK